MKEKFKDKKSLKKEKIKMSLNEYQNNEMPVLWEIFDFATNIPSTLYGDHVGVKVPEASYRGSLWSEGVELQSMGYLLNEKKSSYDMSMPIGVFGYASLGPRGGMCYRGLKEEDTIKRNGYIELPQPQPINTSIGTVIRSRRSLRDFSGDDLSIQEISNLLFYGDGVSGIFQHNPRGDELPASSTLGSVYNSTVRTAPSGGGTYPVDLYLVILRCSKIPAGVYKYLPEHHALESVRDFDEGDMETFKAKNVLGTNIDMDKVAVCLFYIYKIFDNSRKYGDRGLMFAAIEAGEISENVHLISTAMNLASTDIGGFDKVLMEQELGIDGLTKHIIHLTLIGKRR